MLSVDNVVGESLRSSSPSVAQVVEEEAPGLRVVGEKTVHLFSPNLLEEQRTVVGVLPNTSGVHEEAVVMAEGRANQLIAEIEAIFFQLTKIAEDLEERIDVMGNNELNSCLTDLKD